MTHHRPRTGSWRTFETRYAPIPKPDGAMLRDYEEVPPEAAPEEVWTAVDCEDGKIRLVPGFALVNKIGYVLCEKRWPDDEYTKPGYMY